MVYAVARSKEYLEEGYEPDLDGDFKPNMINSVVFLVEAVQQVLLRLYLVLAVVLLSVHSGTSGTRYVSYHPVPVCISVFCVFA